MAAKKIIAAASVAALAGCAAYVDHRASDREAQAEADFPPLGQIIDVGGVPVHALVQGEGPDVVLIHGAGGNLRDFAFQFMGRMSDRYRVIAFDRPGLGYTGRTDPRYAQAFTNEAESPAEQAALLQAAAAQLGADRPIVLGHSFGGAVAFAWGVNHPDNIAGLVSVAGVALPWEGGLGLYYTVPGSTVGSGVVPPLVTAFVGEDRVQEGIESTFTPNVMPDGYDDFIGAPLTIRRDSFRANARQVNGLLPFVVEQSQFYAQFDFPVELIHGDADTTVPLDIHARPASEMIPDANLTILEDVGHMPHHVDPQAVEDAIDRIAERAGLR